MKLARFTLRDLFWLVLVVGMGIGWWVDHWLQSERIAKLTPKLTPKLLPQHVLTRMVGPNKQVGNAPTEAYGDENPTKRATRSTKRSGTHTHNDSLTLEQIRSLQVPTQN